jgi:hypothetical protein
MSHNDTSSRAAHMAKRIPVFHGAYQAHTISSPFCWDIRCACHHDVEACMQVAQAHRDGLCTVEEAARLVAGKQV